MPTSLVQLTTRQLRNLGYDYDVVARRIPNGNPRKYGPTRTIAVDWMNFADLMAVRAGTPGILAVQVCGTAEVLEHTERYKSDEPRGTRKLVIRNRIRNFLDGTGNRFQIWGWEKSSEGWQLLVIQCTLSDQGNPHFKGLDRPV